MGHGRVGLELECPAIGGDRLVEPAQGMQGDAQVAVGLGMVGIERDGAAEGGDRLVEPAHVGPGAAQVAVGPGRRGLERDGPAVGRDRLLEPARLLEGPQVVVRVGMSGLSSMAKRNAAIASSNRPVWRSVEPRL